MNIDLEISNLVKAARVKQAKEGLKKSVEKWNSFHWGGGWFGYGSIFRVVEGDVR